MARVEPMASCNKGMTIRTITLRNLGVSNQLKAVVRKRDQGASRVTVAAETATGVIWKNNGIYEKYAV